MKAAVVVEKNILKVQEVPDPIPGEYDALCELLYGAVCTGTDIHIIQDTFPFFRMPYPTIIGHESIGRVIKIGRKVRNFRLGDLVTRVGAPDTEGYASTWGGFATLGIARDHWAMARDGLKTSLWEPYRSNQVIPSGINPAEAVMIVTWRETLSYIKRMGVGPGSRVLILGSGGNGLAFANHSVNLGADKVVMTGNIDRQKTAMEIKVTAFYNYKCQGIKELIQETCPEGFDFIIDAVGKSGTLNEMLPLLKDGGTVGIYGLDELNTVFINPMKAQKSFRFYNGGYDEEETHHAVVSAMIKGQLKAAHWLNLGSPFPLENINEAFESAIARKSIKPLIELQGGIRG